MVSPHTWTTRRGSTRHRPLHYLLRAKGSNRLDFDAEHRSCPTRSGCGHIPIDQPQQGVYDVAPPMAHPRLAYQEHEATTQNSGWDPVHAWEDSGSLLEGLAGPRGCGP